MKTREIIESRVEKPIDTNWMYYDPGSESDMLEAVTDDNIKEAAEVLKVSPEFLKMMNETIRRMANEIIEELSLDLEDIWKKVNE